MDRRSCSKRGFYLKCIKKISFCSHHLLCEIFAEWSFFLFMYFVSYKKISSPRQINIFYWISIASSGLSDESGRFNKKRQSNGRNFLVCIATADLRTDLEYGKSFMG